MNIDVSRVLYPEQIDKLALVIAEISEAQYRKGWIDALESQNDDEESTATPAELMALSYHWSPYCQTGKGGMLSIDRLALAHGHRLASVGIQLVPFNSYLVEVEE